MKVNLAGFNFDADQIIRFSNYLKLNCKDSLLKAEFEKILFTPETISAAYARISRSKKSVDKLRENAIEDIEKARKSNRMIVFDMGHSSIAEHAVFNFDIIGISRYLTEYIQRTRLASYTEKSQRYVTLDGDFVIPSELQNDGDLEKEFVATVQKQNEAYFDIYRSIKTYLISNSHSEGGEHLAEKAKQDARYILALATKTQMGMTINARSIERLLKRLYALNINEATDFADKMYAKVMAIAPSLIRYTKPSAYDKRLYIREETADFNSKIESVTHIDHTEDIENKIISTLLFRKNGNDFRQIANKVRQMSHSDKMRLIKNELNGLETWDALPRAFEMGNFTFQLKISSSCFAQLKRHRLASIVESDYNPKYGFTIPKTVIRSGNQKIFENIIKDTNQLYGKLQSKNVNIKNYILTNSQNRIVLFTFNLRELSHFARLRQDKHAQWEIRDIADKIVAQCKEIAPIVTSAISGKDIFHP